MRKGIKTVFNVAAGSLAAVAILAGAGAGILGGLRLYETASQQTQTCTVTESYVSAAYGRVKNTGFSRKINFIRTQECGTLRNDTVSIPLLTQPDFKTNYCAIKPGDTVQVRTFKRLPGMEAQFVHHVIKREKTDPGMAAREDPHATKQRADFCKPF